MSPSTVLNPKMLFLSSFLMMMRSDGSLKMSLMFFPVSAIFVMLFCFFYCQAAELPGTVVVVFAGVGGACGMPGIPGAATPDAEFPEWLRLGRIARSGFALFGIPGITRAAAPWTECADGLCLGRGGVVYMDRHQ